MTSHFLDLLLVQDAYINSIFINMARICNSATETIWSKGVFCAIIGKRLELAPEYWIFKSKQDYQPNFHLLNIACYWYSAVVCLS